MRSEASAFNDESGYTPYQIARHIYESGRVAPAALIVATRNESACSSFEGHVCRAGGGRMPSSQYYRVQAKVLLMLMLAMRDSKRAARVEAKAREYLAQAQLPDEDAHELNAILEEFNNSQLRKGRPQEG
jgi:hypothetical protein